MATKTKPKSKLDVTSDKPAKSDNQNYAILGKNESGWLGQFFGGEQEYGGNQTQLRQTAQDFHGIDSKQWAGLTSEQKAEAIASALKGINTGTDESGLAGDIDPKTLKKVDQTAKTAALPSPTTAAKTVTNQSPYEELANALASSYLQQAQQLQGMVSGTAAPGLEQQAAAGASTSLQQLLGGGATPLLQSMQGFLSSAPQAPLQGMVNAAQQGQANAQSQADLGVAGSIGQTGLANTEYLASAPYQQILQELANETAYKAASGTGAAAFGANTANTPAWLQSVFTNLGLNVPPPSANGQPSTNPLATPGTTPKKAATGATSGTVSADNSNSSAP